MPNGTYGGVGGGGGDAPAYRIEDLSCKDFFAQDASDRGPQ